MNTGQECPEKQVNELLLNHNLAWFRYTDL